MKIVALSDTHGYHYRTKLPPGDVLMFAGDMTSMGRPEEVSNFSQWLQCKARDFKKIIVIAGDCDEGFVYNPDLFREILTGDNRVIYLQDSGVEFGGIKFWGTPVVPYCNRDKFINSNNSIDFHWDKIPRDTDVLITHCPPYCILDKTIYNRHEGCTRLASKVSKLRLRLHVFGHIHDAYGINEINNTIFANVSFCSALYNLIREPMIFDL